MVGEKKWVPGPANENSDESVDELGKPLEKREENTPDGTQEVPREPKEMEEWIDGEPPIHQG